MTRAIEQAAVEGPEEIGPADFEKVLREARAAHDRVQRAAYHELHRDPYRPEMAEGILARVPPDLDALNESVVVRAASRFGFEVEAQSGERTWRIEYGYEALVDHFFGVPLGTTLLGTFSRERAVDEETLDFFSSGHPLVEGILAELEEGPRGRVALLQIPGDEETFGLLALYRDAHDNADWRAVAVDAKGQPRPDLAEAPDRRSARDRADRGQEVDQPGELEKGDPQDGRRPPQGGEAAGGGGVPGTPAVLSCS